MEVKKTQKADIQNKRGLFFQIGLCVSLLLMIGVFSSGKEEVRAAELVDRGEWIEPNVVNITRPEPPKPPESAVPRVQVNTEILNIVRNNRPINYQIDFGDPEDGVPFVWGPPEGAGGGLVVDDDPVVVAEDPAAFSEGDFSAWMRGQVGGENYPVMAAQNGIQGRVVVKFVVERDGSVSNIEVLSSPERVLSEAVIAAIKRAPKWTPAKNRGIPVRSWFTLPVDFRLAQ